MLDLDHKFGLDILCFCIMFLKRNHLDFHICKCPCLQLLITIEKVLICTVATLACCYSETNFFNRNLNIVNITKTFFSFNINRGYNNPSDIKDCIMVVRLSYDMIYAKMSLYNVPFF